jgi:hypothetical protein
MRVMNDGEANDQRCLRTSDGYETIGRIRWNGREESSKKRRCHSERRKALWTVLFTVGVKSGVDKAHGPPF